MYILHNGYPVEATDLHYETLADIEVQVLAWLKELLEGGSRSESPICG